MQPWLSHGIYICTKFVFLPLILIFIVEVLLGFLHSHEISTTVELSTSCSIWLTVKVLVCGVHQPPTGKFHVEINHQPWLILTGQKAVGLLVELQLMQLNFKTLVMKIPAIKFAMNSAQSETTGSVHRFSCTSCKRTATQLDCNW